MIKLQIRRKTAKVWQHFIVDGNDFIFSKCYCKTNGDKFRVVEDGGTAKNEYNFDEIEVYDDLNGGGAETFTSSLELMERLSALQYVGFNKDGDVVIADLISSDSSNALEEGSDGKLFVSESSGGGIESVTGTMVENSDPLNPVILSDNTKLNKVSTAGVERAYIINADGSQGVKETSKFKDVLEFANLASFPATGESGKIYLAIDTNLTYRWGGSSYVVMSSSLALGETSSTAYRGDRGKIAYDHSQTIGNPHGTTKNDIGLSNVDNTSDLNKPISTATQTTLDLKENAANKATDLSSPDNTKYPTTLAVANETKKATITVELISQLTTNFYAPSALRINDTELISGSGTLSLKVNDVAYTLTDLIPQGAKITTETTSSSVYNLISIYE